MKSVAKVLQVLETLCIYDATGLSELSDKLNVHRTSAYRFLSALTRVRYVEKDELTKKYYPSLKVFQLGVSARNRKL
jgi:IclR family KDG regulon transcriptional repressor